MTKTTSTTSAKTSIASLATSSAKPSAPSSATKSAKSSKTLSQRKRTVREKVSYAVFVLAWTAFSATASQFIIFFPMHWLLGTHASEPLWTLVFYVLYNTLAVTLVIFVPPKLAAIYRRNHSADGKLKPLAKKSAKTSAKSDISARPESKPATTSKAETIKTANTAETAAESDSLFSTNPEELGIANWPTFVDIGLAPIAYVAYAMLANIIISIFRAFTWFNASQEQNVGFGYFLTTGDRVLAMLAIVFIAPIAEELIMRGWLYGKLRNKFKIPLAIFLTSALFAVLHGQLNVAVTVFALSVVLCGLREITGTIWSGMLLHILSNGIAFYMLYVAI